MASLSSHDKGKKSFEGRRYKQDVAVGVDAFEKTWAPTFKWNKQRSKNHKAQYNPERIFLYGNHEARLDKTVQLQPELEGDFCLAAALLDVDNNVVGMADKDLTTQSGLFFNYQKMEKGVFFISKTQAFYNLCCQLLHGDRSTDNIRGIDFVSRELKENYKVSTK